MAGLKEVDIVVEFGRRFSGEVGFLEAPIWRGDLRSLAARAEIDVEEERVRVRGRIETDREMQRRKGEAVIAVRCMLLTKGGEQA